MGQGHTGPVGAGVRRRLTQVVVAAAVAAGLVPVATAPAQALSFEVSSTADADDPTNDGICRTAAGECTLRAALTEAKRQPGRDTITFNIPGTGPFVIQPATALPSLTDPAGTVVDGYTQPGAAPNTDPVADNAVIRVQLVGPGPNTFPGFLVNSQGNVLRGLSIRGFRHNVQLYGPLATGNQVVGSFIGTDPSGTATAPAAAPGNSGVTLQAGASDNLVGTPAPADRNVLSGNYQNGVAFYDNGTSRNLVRNNIIGLTPSGTGRLGNMNHGVDVNTWASDNVIGGTGTREGNVVSGNLNTGVEISHNPPTLRNRVIGNLVGTTVNGQATPSSVNNQFGVRLEGAASCDLCALDAGESTVADNVIVNNLKGGLLVDKGFHDSTIRDNRVGVLADGTPAPNGNFGIRVAHGATRITVGPGNVVANNPNGVQVDVFGVSPENVTSTATAGNTVTRNAIYDNGLSLGLDLTPLGSANTTATAEPNANDAVQAPVLTVPDAGHVTGVACAGCTVEVFESDKPADHVGSGRRYVGRADADASGRFSVALDAAAAGSVVTATATLPAGGTSEFARNKAVPAAAAGNAPPVAVAAVACTRVTCTFDAAGSTDADGTVVGVVWDFGDGTEKVQGTAVTHTYQVAGSYPVTVTAVDNGGARATTTVTAAPTNLLPVAAATVSCTNLTCSFDGTGSSDPDGTVLARAWDFGDGTSDTGAVVTHTFGTAGTYAVRLTVTDDLAGQASTTVQAVARTPPAGRVGEDTFTRSRTSGWGSAPTGGAYTFGSGSTDLSVNGTQGLMSVRTSGGTRSAFLPVNRRDTDQRVTVSIDKTPTSNGASVSLVSRSTAANVNYRARARLAGDGSVRLAFTKAVGGNETLIGTEITVPGLTYAAGTPLTVRMLTQGVSPTTLSAKVWRTAAAEPADWTLVRTDTDAALTGNGSTGVISFVSPSMTGVPVVFSYDDLLVDAVNVPPVAAGSVTCAHRDCTFSSAGSSDLDGSIAGYLWEFGDGTTSSGANPVHTYPSIRTQTATLTVTDNGGLTSSVDVPVVMTTQPPTAVAALACTKLTCTASAAGSADPDGTITSYTWDWSDGTSDSGSTATHTFTATGPVSVQLTVVDDDGLSSAATASGATAGNQPPVARATVTCAFLTCTADGTASSDPDDAVASYAWDWGDGATSTGATSSHAYVAAGDVPVTVRVTDADGATSSVTVTASPTQPATDQPPVAVPSVACVRLTCTASGAGSSDPDGTVVSYAWDWGDGATSIGVTATHAYATGGTRSVTLTVTDDAGATGTASQAINPQPAVVVFASDAFGRAAANGWGSADLGGAWTVSSTPSNFAVSGGAGRITLPSAGQGRSVRLDAVSRTDSDTAVTVQFDKAATGSGDYASVIGRRTGANLEYRARLRVSGSSAFLSLVRLSGTTTETLIGTETRLGISYAAGTKVTVRLQVTGTETTSLQAKAWVAGTVEPTAWTVTGSDTTAALQAAGSVGVHSLLSSSVTNAPVVASFTDFSSRTTQPVG